MAEQPRRRFIDASTWLRRREQRHEQATDSSAPRLDYQQLATITPAGGRRPGRPPASRRPRPPAADQAGLPEAILGDFRGRWRDTPHGTVWEFNRPPAHPMPPPRRARSHATARP